MAAGRDSPAAPSAPVVPRAAMAAGRDSPAAPSAFLVGPPGLPPVMVEQ